MLGAGALAESKLLAGQGSQALLNKGDVAISRLLAAAEIVEADLWAAVHGAWRGDERHTNNYQLALQFLDGDASQYITSNTLDEVSHAAFINAYLESKGEEPVNLDRFRILPSSQATGAQDIGRLTNLMKLNVDTSWYIRDRNTTSPDFGAKFQ